MDDNRLPSSSAQPGSGAPSKHEDMEVDPVDEPVSAAPASRKRNKGDAMQVDTTSSRMKRGLQEAGGPVMSPHASLLPQTVIRRHESTNLAGKGKVPRPLTNDADVAFSQSGDTGGRKTASWEKDADELQQLIADAETGAAVKQQNYVFEAKVQLKVDEIKRELEAKYAAEKTEWVEQQAEVAENQYTTLIEGEKARLQEESKEITAVLQTKIERLEHEKQQLQSQYDEQHASLRRFETGARVMAKEIDDLTAEVKQVEQRAEEKAKREATAHEAEVKTLRHALDEAREERESIEAASRDKQKSSAVLIKMLEASKKDAARVQKEMEQEAKQEATRLKQEFRERLDQAVRESEALNEQVESLSKELLRLQSQPPAFRPLSVDMAPDDALTHQVELLRLEIETLKTKNETLKGEAAWANAAKKKAEMDRKGAQEKTHDVTDMAQDDEEMSALAGQLNALRAENSKLKQHIETLKHEKANAQHETKTLEAKLKAAQPPKDKGNSDKDDPCKDVKDKLKKAEKDLADANRRIEQLRKEVQTLRDKATRDMVSLQQKLQNASQKGAREKAKELDKQLKDAIRAKEIPDGLAEAVQRQQDELQDLYNTVEQYEAQFNKTIAEEEFVIPGREFVALLRSMGSGLYSKDNRMDEEGLKFIRFREYIVSLDYGINRLLKAAEDAKPTLHAAPQTPDAIDQICGFISQTIKWQKDQIAEANKKGATFEKETRKQLEVYDKDRKRLMVELHEAKSQLALLTGELAAIRAAATADSTSSPPFPLRITYPLPNEPPVEQGRALFDALWKRVATSLERQDAFPLETIPDDDAMVIDHDEAGLKNKKAEEDRKQEQKRVVDWFSLVVRGLVAMLYETNALLHTHMVGEPLGGRTAQLGVQLLMYGHFLDGGSEKYLAPLRRGLNAARENAQRHLQSTVRRDLLEAHLLTVAHACENLLDRGLRLASSDTLLQPLGSSAGIHTMISLLTKLREKLAPYEQHVAVFKKFETLFAKDFSKLPTFADEILLRLKETALNTTIALGPENGVSAWREGGVSEAELAVITREFQALADARQTVAEMSELIAEVQRLTGKDNALVKGFKPLSVSDKPLSKSDSTAAVLRLRHALYNAFAVLHFHIPQPAEYPLWVQQTFAEVEAALKEGKAWDSKDAKLVAKVAEFKRMDSAVKDARLVLRLMASLWGWRQGQMENMDTVRQLFGNPVPDVPVPVSEEEWMNGAMAGLTSDAQRAPEIVALLQGLSEPVKQGTAKVHKYIQRMVDADTKGAMKLLPLLRSLYQIMIPSMMEDPEHRDLETYASSLETKFSTIQTQVSNILDAMSARDHDQLENKLMKAAKDAFAKAMVFYWSETHDLTKTDALFKRWMDSLPSDLKDLKVGDDLRRLSQRLLEEAKNQKKGAKGGGGDEGPVPRDVMIRLGVADRMSVDFDQFLMFLQLMAGNIPGSLHLVIRRDYLSIDRLLSEDPVVPAAIQDETKASESTESDEERIKRAEGRAIAFDKKTAHEAYAAIVTSPAYTAIETALLFLQRSLKTKQSMADRFWVLISDRDKRERFADMCACEYLFRQVFVEEKPKPPGLVAVLNRRRQQAVYAFLPNGAQGS